MADFKFVQNSLTKKWIILSPRRAKRPDVAHGAEPICPFCLGREKEEPSVYQIPPLQSVIPNSFRDLNQESNEMLKQVQHDNKNEWQVRVINNKYPFAPIHE